MPCFSASKLRFVGQNPPLYSEKDRAKLSYSARPQSRQCEEFYKAQDLNKHATVLASRNKSRQNQDRKYGKKSATLGRAELERLRNASKVITVEERLDALMKQEQETKRMEQEAENTKRRYKEIDDARKKAEEAKMEKEDLFGANEKVKVLERAFLAKHEQEEEVKKVNRIILNAKCHAVRDAQLQEKNDLAKELRDDERRLENMVIERAISGLNQEDEQFEKEKTKKMTYAKDIRQQLNERENLRFIEAERIEEEAKMLKRANEALKRDDERQAQMQHERRSAFRAELNRIVEMSQLFKKMLCEQEREAELRVAAYMRDKEKRERALALEKKLAKEAMENKQQRIFMLAEKMQDSKSQRDEMSYIREQERIEREYRRKEKEAALRKKRIEHDLTEARERQLEETKHRQALQIARAEKDFEMLVERLKQDEAKEKRENIERECRRKGYRTDIIRQMNDKELERRRLIELEKSRAAAWRESERQRDSNIRAVVNAKLAAMRDACLPEKYIKDVEMQIKKISAGRGNQITKL